MVQVPATSMPSTVHIPSPLPVVCLALGDLYGLADRYITRMQGMLETHCPVPFKLICYSDLPRGFYTLEGRQVYGRFVGSRPNQFWSVASLLPRGVAKLRALVGPGSSSVTLSA